jgi:hypothetical protein
MCPLGAGQRPESDRASAVPGSAINALHRAPAPLPRGATACCLAPASFGNGGCRTSGERCWHSIPSPPSLPNGAPLLRQHPQIQDAHLAATVIELLAELDASADLQTLQTVRQCGNVHKNIGVGAVGIYKPEAALEPGFHSTLCHLSVTL